MPRYMPFILALLLVLASCDLLLGDTSFQEVNFTVAPSAKQTIAAEVKAGHSVEGSFSVTGKETYIDFYIKDPSGGLPYGVVRAQGGHSFEMQAETTGVYTLYFDNAISFGSARDISLRYRVR